MKILHTADWHIGTFPGPESKGMNLRGLDTKNCLLNMYEQAKEEKPDIMLVSGDIFHQARVWSDRGLDETQIAIQMLTKFEAICPVVVLRGTPNHDGAEQFSMLETHFEHDEGVYIITEPKTIILNTFKGEKIQIAGLPGFDRGEYRAKHPGLAKEDENQVFTEELGKIVLGLRAQMNDQAPKVLMAHYTVPGCNTESGQTQFLVQFEPIVQPEALDAAGFDLVALGHIHRPQQVLSCHNTFYSGAVNAMNFNDEGQKRGFWIHDFTGHSIASSTFHELPARKFITFDFTDTDIAGINTGELDNVAFNLWGYSNDVKDKIVRIIYSCSESNNKAFNRALLEKKLYEDGAFWVSEITPDKISVSANRNNLSEQSDPEANLRDYLEEKAMPEDKITEIIEAARPIIDEATANNVISRISGMFVPVEIQVKNYRNYSEEKFNFSDISFCTINGKNGAGKSSLFMDAILDCLYEEPREGDLTGWIKADESARSGSITFTFSIGDKTFRVARTRAKSGKATLNISELIDGEWENRSKEKIRDTQNEIISILGMDSLTFRSCALIMQDQYGLFLQADKESRMTILSNILGLGIYGDMESLAKAKATDLNRQIYQKNSEVEKAQSDILILGNPESDIAVVEEQSKNLENSKADLNLQRDNINLKLSSKLQAAERAEKAQISVNTLVGKKIQHEAAIQYQQTIISEADITLSKSDEIQSGIIKYNNLLEQEKELLKGKTLYDTKIKELEDARSSIQLTEDAIRKLQQITEQENIKLRSLDQQLQREPELSAAVKKYDIAKSELAALDARTEMVMSLTNAITQERQKLSNLVSEYNSEAATRTTTIKNYQTRVSLLKDCNCIDVKKADCKFLSDAKAAQEKLNPYIAQCSAWKQQELAKQKEINNNLENLQKQLSSLGYDAQKVRLKRTEVSTLEIQVKQYEQLSVAKEQRRAVLERLDSNAIAISDSNKRLAQLKSDADSITNSITEYQAAARDYENLQFQLTYYKKFFDMEKELPVAREKKLTATKRIEELRSEIQSMDAEMSALQEEIIKELEIANGSEELQKNLLEIETDLSSIQSQLDEFKIRIGALQQKAKNLQTGRKTIAVLQEQINALSSEVVKLETLKQAFSQDGVPHNIICSIIPSLTATANSILGQMTGGKMGMEFLTEKVLKSNSKKEVVTLDILINEYGKDILPYLSKSGGEKVKASLSAILALAETKSSQAGIQLGMLFIDEPPFLDGDGIQAYCDALETIQRRYSNIKIMAITHDPTMKARFPQSLEVIKTEDSSKVLID